MNEVSAIAPFDFHVHTGLSHDGRGTVMEYCELAAGRGMKAVGFCEHVDLDPRDPVCGQHDYEGCLAAIEQAREAFGDRLIIGMGAEVGYVPRLEQDIRDFLDGHAYDFVIGSVHTIGDGMAGVSDEYDALETFARHEVMDVYAEYFDTVQQMVVSGLFDVVGHLDLVNRYGAGYLKHDLEWGNFYGVLRLIMEGVIKRQMSLEINTSGLRQAPEATYPPRPVLKLYREIGGEHVLIGSDAHSPDQLGAGVPAAIIISRQLGLNPFITYSNRIQREIGG